MAEARGFEPMVACTTLVFKTEYTPAAAASERLLLGILSFADLLEIRLREF